MLTSEQNLCEMALVKNAARNGAVCYHHDSKVIFVQWATKVMTPAYVYFLWKHGS